MGLLQLLKMLLTIGLSLYDGGITQAKEPAMRLICTILATLTICCCFAAEEASKLPRDAQTAMDGYNKAAAKLEDDYKYKLGAEREKLYAALDKANKEAAKKGDADSILAIKAEQKKILAEAAKDDDTDLLGEKLKRFALIKVEFGVGTTWLDATKWAQKQTKNGEAEFDDFALGGELGDPAPGQGKSIKITYSDGVGEKTKLYSNHAKVHLPIKEDEPKK